ncbi:AAA family ATPase [Nocardiopsis sp. RSe5-2]|uniref:AAA family ATPase n=1 Tax=Nocardiopsis endophytica TaxID=3018445 RepID=A0ABT4TZV7_9ACTN|nr:AAA family ATPase [Nocardiopsis endophytica]MDA2809961.1 AAA family ATPase [Nocardiopsis endophytica]
MTRSSVILITGVMASGKSTVARMLAERLPKAAYIPGDVFRRMMVSGREDPSPHGTPEALSQLRLRYRASAAVADEYASDGWTAVVQDVVLGGELAEYAALVRTRPLYVVVLAPSAQVVARRERERPKSGYGAWTVEDLDRILREDTPALGLWIDTSDQTPEETVQAVLADLDKARCPHP